MQLTMSVGLEPVALDHVAHELLRRVEDRLGGVLVDGGRAPERAQLHGAIVPEDRRLPQRARPRPPTGGVRRPGARSPRRSGPNATRSSAATRWPTASHIRRTWRLRPSRIVISQQPRLRAARPPPARSGRPRARRRRAGRAAPLSATRCGSTLRAVGLRAPRSGGGSAARRARRRWSAGSARCVSASRRPTG